MISLDPDTEKPHDRPMSMLHLMSRNKNRIRNSDYYTCCACGKEIYFANDYTATHSSRRTYAEGRGYYTNSDRKNIPLSKGTGIPHRCSGDGVKRRKISHFISEVFQAAAAAAAEEKQTLQTLTKYNADKARIISARISMAKQLKAQEQQSHHVIASADVQVIECSQSP